MMCKNVNIKHDLSQQLEFDSELNIRKKKLLQLRKEYKVLFPNDFRRDYVSSKLHKKYKCKTSDELKALNIKVSIAGRMMTRRVMGKATFITLRDGEGCIQLYVTVDSLGSNTMYKKYIKQWDLGDIIGVKGVLFKTRTGELSIYCLEMRLLTKSLRSIPNKFHGLHNIEIRYRQRYLDLITNHRSRQIFKTRSIIISEIRQFMKERDFIEVETPMMHVVPGGAVAKPFVTYHNKFKMNMYLRIAPELYLKKLIVGGFERIFEINRNFRNESISPNHNPEFTMMEIYIAYADYLDMIKFIQDLFQSLIERVLGNNIVKYDDYNLDFKSPFIKMSIKEAIVHYLTEIQSEDDVNDLSVMINVARSFNIPIDQDWNIERLYMVLFEEIISKKIIQPTFITHYPIEVSPLARCNDINPKIADRFELFIAGREIGNGFSELNDPEDQRKRFLKQVYDQNIKSTIESTHHSYDEDYLTALEYGLPPTAGVGIGIDRLIMLLTNTLHIRDVILFPTLRPKIK